MADKWIQLMSEDGTNNLFPTSKMDLLWENVSPSSTFDAQTIALDLNGYAAVVIVLCFNTSAINSISYTKVPITASGVSVSCFSDTDTHARFRMVSTTNTGITFGGGRHSNGTDNNSGRAIPYKIYGIK